MGPRVSINAGRSYSWWDASTGTGTRYWVEELDLNGTGTWYGPARAVEGRGPEPTASQKQNSQLLAALGASSQPRYRQVAVARVAATTTTQSTVNLTARQALKLSISHPGWYRVPLKTLSANGLAVGSGSELHLYAEGVKQPLMLRSDGVEFYGTGLDKPSTGTRVYWLVNGALNKHFISTLPPSSSSGTSNDFTATVVRQDRSTYFPAANETNGEDFFGALVGAPPSPLAPVDQTITAAHLSRPDGAMLEVALEGVTDGPHNVTVQLNGTLMGNVTFSGIAGGVATFPATSIIDGDNTVALTAGADGDINLVDHITLTYQRSYTADADSLQFTAAGSAQVSVGGFTNSQVRMVDITDPLAVQELTVTPGSNGTYMATMTGSGTRTVLAFAADAVAAPDAMALHKPLRLTPLAGRVDTILVTTANLMNTVQPLIKFRAKQGLQVKAVDIEQIYDAFSFGEVDPQAIKDFLQATQSGAKQAPHYVLLVGDASYDPRNFLGNPPDPYVVSTELINTEAFQAPSDGWFADFGNTGIPQMAVGRLPVTTPEAITAGTTGPAALEALISKIISYDEVTPSHNFLLTADDEPGFIQSSTEVATLLPAGSSATTLNRDSTSSNHDELIDDINASPDLVNYFGHGNINFWADNWFTDTDAVGLTNSARPAVFVLMTCLNGYFVDPQHDSLAESLLGAKGGAVAVWASSGDTVPSGQLQANQALYQQLFGSNAPPTLGDAVSQAKAATSDPDVRQTWNLLGDPETHLR